MTVVNHLDLFHFLKQRVGRLLNSVAVQAVAGKIEYQKYGLEDRIATVETDDGIYNCNVHPVKQRAVSGCFITKKKLKKGFQ